MKNTETDINTIPLSFLDLAPVPTGSTIADGIAQTVEIAQKYADQVLHFEWCDDFSAARTTGIDAAKGLWFMWIDSDEWIENPDSMIDFFKF